MFAVYDTCVINSITVYAHRDADEGDNALITYTLVPIDGAHSDWFTVHNSSGMIRTAKEPIVCSTDFTPRQVKPTCHSDTCAIHAYP